MPMRQVEIAAKSVDEAVRLALEQLNRSRDEVDVQVLSGSETGDEDDEVLVRVTARERLSGRAVAAVPPSPPPVAPPAPRAERTERTERLARAPHIQRVAPPARAA